MYLVISGTERYTTGFPQLCNTIISVIDSILDPSGSIDISDPPVQTFLKQALPALTEAFLRRNTLREHEEDVAKVLLAVSRLLAKPASHDFVELCELRNMLLIGNIPPPLKFIDPKQFANNQYAGNHFSSETFYGDFGIPCVAYIGNKTLTFWPDEWQRALGGIKAVGHYVQWHHEEQPSKGSGNELTGWLVGRVVSFTRETAEHTIQLEPASAAGNNAPEGDKHNSETAQSEAGVNKEPVQVFRSVNLSKVKHHWIDSVFRSRITLHPTPTASAQVPVGDSLLEFANTDVGQFIRLWWTRYSKYFYGRVVRFDPVSKMHTVCYEDGDTRAYDMLTKDYSIIVPPHEVMNADSEANLSDAQAAKIVADWHRALESTQAGAAEATAKEMQLHQGEAVSYKFTFIHRPLSVNALTVSIHHLAVVDEYFKEGGADAMFQSLTDASQSPPVSRIILLHLQLIYQLRNFLGVEKFTELAWDLKEAVPFALLRYEDTQIKDLNPKTLNDLLNGLQDMMLHLVSNSSTNNGTNSGNQYTSNSAVRDAIDELRLAVAGMLLVCSQLQKRYLGLSMIKDTLDVLLPQLDNYVTKRYAAIGLSRSMRAPPTRPGPSPPKSQRITKDYLDKWLVENNILEILFGESLHQDLVAKSDILLLYMGSRKVLTEKHIDLIWNASLGVHEAVVRVLHQLLVLIVPVLGAPLRNYLFSLMAALPCKDYTEQILQLIKAFTEQALIASKEDSNSNTPAASGANAGASVSAESNNNNSTSYNNPMSLSGNSGAGALGRKGQVVNAPQRQWMGFGVLWQFVQDPAVSGHHTSSGEGGVAGGSGVKPAQDAVAEGLVDLAVQLLVELLQEEFKDERELVMQRCLDNIQAGRSVPVSLQILRRTLALFPQAPKSWFVLNRPGAAKTATVAHQIEKLIKNSQLLEILFKDLDAYHRSILATGNGGDGGSSSSAVNNSAAGMKTSRSLLGIDKIVPKMMLRGNNAQSTAASASQASAPAGASKSPAIVSGRASQLKGVSERLDFLRFIISWSSVKLSEQQTMILWNAFGEGANSVETLEKLFLWFNVLINKESKPLTALLNSISQESDPTDPDQRSKLVFLAPQLLTLIQQQSYNSFNASGSQSLIALLAESSEGEETNYSGGTGAGTAASSEVHSTFDDGVLMKLFEESIMKWAFRIEKVDSLSRLPVANLCFKLFFHTNIVNKSIKVEADGTWFRVGPLSGLPLLWRIALDATDLTVAYAAIALLIELHHKCVPSQKAAKVGDLGYKAHLLQLCFKHLYRSLNSLQLEDGCSPTAPVPPAADGVGLASSRPGSGPPAAPTLESSTANDEWFNDKDTLMKRSVIAARIERLILTLRLAVHRHYMAPIVLHTIKILVGREEAPVFTVVLKATDSVGLLRRKVAEYFKEPVESIQLLKAPVKSTTLLGLGGPTQEILDKDDLTLVQAKLNVQDSITARKNDPSGSTEIGTAPGSMQPPKPRAGDVADLFTPQDLSINLLKPLSPLEWIDAAVSTSGGAGGDGSVRTPYELFVLPPFPLVSVIETKLKRQESCHAIATADETAAVSIKGPPVAAKETPTASVSPIIASSERRQKVLESLTPLFRTAPQYIDQLLEILDGYLSAEAANSSNASSSVDLSAAVWDILLSLPVHAALSQQLKSMVQTTDPSASALNRLLTPSCPYRLLYSLRIIETFLSLGSASNAFPKGSAGTTTTTASAAVLDWTVKFFHIGGAEYILQLLDTFLAKECQREVKYAKMGGSKVAGRTRASPQQKEGMPRKDLNIMIISTLSRVLYHLLMLDPHFRGWQSSSANEIQSRLYATCDDNADNQAAEIVPAGVILSNVDVPSLCTNIMQCSLQAAELYKVQLITSAALRALCENAFLLMFGLLSSVEDGFEIVSKSPLFRPWLDALCVRCSSKSVRQAACRRLFEVSANVFNKCADPTIAQDDKRSRLRLYDFIQEEIIACISSDGTLTKSTEASTLNIRIKNGEEVYSLVAAIEALRNSPYLIFPHISAKRAMRSASGKTSDSVSPRSGDDGSAPVPVDSAADDPVCSLKLAKLFITKLMTHVSRESFHSTEPDGTLVGILRVLLIFANSSEQQRIAMSEVSIELDGSTNSRLIPFVYSNCLFPPLSTNNSAGDASPTANTPYVEFLGTVEAACQTQESRQLAYALLYKLCDSTPSNLAQLVEAIGAEILPSTDAAPKSSVLTEASMEHDPSAAIKRIPTWNYDPDTLLKEPDAYVGLCNQGGTCYMNSFIQQLFHIPAFKTGLLRINAAAKTTKDAAGNNSLEEKPDPNVELLFQLQVMFGFMNFSQKRYYDTLPFCRTFLDYDGEPISLTEQKDINEFAGMLFDKIEHNKEAAALLASTIQGKIVWRTRSIETPYKSEREETFYMLTAEVKDKATLEDSLELFTADELFSGDNKIEDAEAGRKVDALRGCAIRSLPPTLIIHLKRFEFDLETMNRKKVNDHISFPTNLNMFPYTEEGLQAKEDKLRASDPSSATSDGSSDESPEGNDDATPTTPSTTSATRKAESHYQYALKGIVAHVGAIDRGHYYSFIRNPDGEAAGGVWQEFNDRNVLPFSPEAIPLECFGGKEEYVNSNGSPVVRARENNAYLLVYERISTAGEESFEAGRQRLRSESMDETSVSLSGVRGVRSGSIDETQPRRGVSKKVMRAVSTENTEFQRDRFLFHPLHFAFIWQVQQMNSVVVLLQQAKGKLIATDTEQDKKYVYDAVDPAEITLSLTVPTAADEPARSGVESALSHLVLDGMRFIVEVLARARAKSCVQPFLERLEEIVVQDVTGTSARSLLEFLATSEASLLTPSSAASPTSSTTNPTDVLEVRAAQPSAKPRTLMDLEQIERVCHPWLAQMLIFCPHPGTSRLFLRFLLACVKVIRVSQSNPGSATSSTEEVPAHRTTEVFTGEPSAPRVVLNIPPCVSSLIEQILLLTEKPQLDYLGCKENFELRCMFLLQYSGLGNEERALMVHLGAIPRLSCSVMAQYPNLSKTNDIKLHFCIDIIARLIRSARGPNATGSSMVSATVSTADSTKNDATAVNVPIYLKPIDIQAFLGRTFLEEAILLHPNAAFAAAAHVYRLISSEQASMLLDFLAERLCEQLNSNNTGALAAYRPYLRLFSDLLLGPALSDILLHLDALIKIVTKAQLIANRLAGLDSEFLFSVLRLLHTLGTASPEAHNTVMQLKEQWKNIAPKLAAAKRTAVYTSEGVLQSSFLGQNSQKQGNNGNNSSGAGGNASNKATASASSFMMN
eukprot:gene8886-10504_t